MLWFSILYHVYACLQFLCTKLCIFDIKPNRVHLLHNYINPYEQLIASILLSWICVAVCLCSFRFMWQEVFFNFRGTRNAWTCVCNTGCNWSVNSHYHLVRFLIFIFWMQWQRAIWLAEKWVFHTKNIANVTLWL